MNSRSLALVISIALCWSVVDAVDVPVSYTVDDTALKNAVSGTNLTFELHGTSVCTAANYTAVLSIDDVFVARLKRFKPRGGVKPPKTAELRTTLPGVSVPGHLYLRVTGTGVTAVGGACQAQPAIGVLPATCNDGIRNQTESDVDCGGPLCPPCQIGDDCGVPSDCASTICSGGICAASCVDGLQNQDETDVDCGGTVCGDCGEGLGCAVNGDCRQSPVLLTCVSGVCTNHCDDGVLNASETDVDCGGGFPMPNGCEGCAAGQMCNRGSDCASNICTSGVCQ